MPLIIGLTGGIGSGKTTVAGIFAALGASIVDTDAIAHELTGPHGNAMGAIRKEFGDKFVAADGSMDRKNMRDLVFLDDVARRKLESILHPPIRDEVDRRVRLSPGPYALVVVPLLLETGSYRDLIQRVLVVDCSERKQVARAIARGGLDEHTIGAIMAAQVSRPERLQKADDVIVNDGDMQDLQWQVEMLHGKYVELAVGSGQAG